MKLSHLRIVIFLASLAAGLTLGLNARAADASLEWVNPTTNTDGSPIPASGAGSLSSNRVQQGTCSSPGVFGTGQASFNTATPVTSYVVTGLLPGTYCFRVFAKNTYGNESAASNVATKVIPAPTPNPPTLVTVVATLYEIRTSPKGVTWIVRSVGYAPKGTPCFEPALLKDYYPIDREDVSRYTVNPATITGKVGTRCAESA